MENCCRTQRSAIESYFAVPSPSLFVSQPPPNPDQMVLVATGPYTAAPLLLKTAKLVLTISTMWFGPTAALVSGGAEVTEKVPAGPTKPAPTPSKLLSVAGMAGAGSGAETPDGLE